jgi:hypothetical protein
MGSHWDLLAVSAILSQAPGPKSGVVPDMGVGMVLIPILMQAPVWRIEFI